MILDYRPIHRGPATEEPGRRWRIAMPQGRSERCLMVKVVRSIAEGPRRH